MAYINLLEDWVYQIITIYLIDKSVCVINNSINILYYTILYIHNIIFSQLAKSLSHNNYFKYLSFADSILYYFIIGYYGIVAMVETRGVEVNILIDSPHVLYNLYLI